MTIRELLDTYHISHLTESKKFYRIKLDKEIKRQNPSMHI